MKLQQYIYKCENCDTEFMSPELPGDSYGEFLMRSETGKLAYLSSFEDAVFQEVEDIFKENKLISDMNKISQAKVFQNIFGVVCDRALDNSEYQTVRNPSCPTCHLNNCLSWQPTNPPVMIDIQVDLATHNYWNQLSKSNKEETLNNAIKLYLKSNSFRNTNE